MMLCRSLERYKSWHVKWHHDDILCKQISTNDCSLIRATYYKVPRHISHILWDLNSITKHASKNSSCLNFQTERRQSIVWIYYHYVQLSWKVSLQNYDFQSFFMVCGIGVSLSAVRAYLHQAKVEKIKEQYKRSRNRRQTSKTIFTFSFVWCEWATGSHVDLCTLRRCRVRVEALKPRADVTRSPKQGYQWLHKKDLCPPKIKKKDFMFCPHIPLPWTRYCAMLYLLLQMEWARNPLCSLQTETRVSRGDGFCAERLQTRLIDRLTCIKSDILLTLSESNNNKLGVSVTKNTFYINENYYSILFP